MERLNHKRDKANEVSLRQKRKILTCTLHQLFVFAAKNERQKNRIQLNRVEKAMFISPTNAPKVPKLPEHLKNKKSSGHDGILNEINFKPHFG